MNKANKKNILFICKYNRFRSRIAEAYFKKININPSVKIKSAGIVRGSPLDKKQVKIARGFGLDISGKPKGLTTELLKWQNIIVIVADDVPKELFKENKKYGKELFFISQKDAQEDTIGESRKVIRAIIKELDKLSNKIK